jgi:eukaryotic-like serine/threonine-protein kinase
VIKHWIWIGKYLLVMVVALVLGAVLGGLGLFRAATLGTPHLTAAALARFVGYAAALGMLWGAGRRAAEQLRAGGGKAASLSAPALSLATLIVTPSAYGVLMQLIGPFVSRGLRPFVAWIFIVGTIAAAVWFVWALFANADALLEAVGRAGPSEKPKA